MDDTAVSKVRDPSASIRLGPEGNLIQVGREGASRASWKRTRKTGIAQVVLGVSCGFLLVWLVSLLWQWSTDEPVVVTMPPAAPVTAPTASAIAPGQRAAPPASMPECRVVSSPRRLFAVQKGVPPVVRTVGSSVAIGYSKLPGHAMGVALSPRQLEPEIVFRQWKPHPVERVVPWGDPDGELRFDVQRLEARATEDAVLGTVTRMRIKAGSTGLVMTDASDRVHSLWALDAERIVAIDTAPVGQHHAVLVVTEQPAQAFAGWVDGAGLAASELFPLSSDGQPIAHAAIGAGGRGALAIVLLSGEQSLRPVVARLPVARGPERWVPLGVGLTDRLEGPVHAAELSGGAWWVQWSELRDEERQIVGHVVASDLRSTRPALALGASMRASVGAATVGDRLVSFGTAAHEGRRQLWATGLVCAAATAP